MICPKKRSKEKCQNSINLFTSLKYQADFSANASQSKIDGHSPAEEEHVQGKGRAVKLLPSELEEKILLRFFQKEVKKVVLSMKKTER